MGHAFLFRAAHSGTEQQAETETPPPPGAVTRSFAYNAANRMASVSLEGELIMSYRFNGAGERVYRSGSNETVHTVFDPAGHWIGDYDATGTAIQQAIWLDGMPVGLVRNAGNALDLHYVEADALGTPRVVIDPTRDVAVWRWDLGSEAFVMTHHRTASATKKARTLGIAGDSGLIWTALELEMVEVGAIQQRF